MAAVNPHFAEELKKYGAFDFNSCYNCGNCTAVCSLASEEASFPREIVRFSVLGLEDEIKSSLKPWLCYYCGECTTHCPRTAFPGELMMSVRRWLTSVYDWTGLSGLLYRSVALVLSAFIITTAGVIIFGIQSRFDLALMMKYGHLFEVSAILTVFAAILLPNSLRMWWLIILKPGIKVSFRSYMAGVWELIVHMFTQKRTLECDNNKSRWLIHLMLVTGYLGLLVVTVAFDWFSTGSKAVIISGYLLSIVVFSATVIFLFGRVMKKKEVSRFSQTSDWLFVIWLFLMGITAFSVRLFIDLGVLQNNIWIYVVHLTILVQWALVIVPFGKWTHFLYRSFAMYFDKITKNKHLQAA